MRVRITNIDEKANVNDITQLLGLTTTPYLQENTRVQIYQSDEQGRHAVVILPVPHHLEILKLDGIELYEKKLTIIQENTTVNDESFTPPSNTISEPEEGELLYMLLDCRLPEWNITKEGKIDHVSEMEVCDAILLEHADDPTKAVKTLWGKMRGTFRIESTDLQRYDGKSVTIRGKELKLTPVRRKQR